MPQHVNAIWIAISAIGTAASFLIGLRAGFRRDARPDALGDPMHRRAAARLRWRFAAIMLIGFAFVAAALAVMWPVSPRQVWAFMPLVAASYAVLGLWHGLRLTVVAAVLATLALGGFFLLPPQFGLWVTATAGGALVLGGIWLRQV
jgi:hypothetical protein